MCHVACRFRELQNTNLPKTGLDNDLTETEMYWNVAMLPETWSIERIATQSIAFLSNRGRLDSILGISFFNFRRKKTTLLLRWSWFPCCSTVPRCVCHILSAIDGNFSLENCYVRLGWRESINTIAGTRCEFNETKSIGNFVTSTMWNYCSTPSLVSCS